MDRLSANYQEKISVKASRVTSFDAVATQMHLWWTTRAKGKFKRVGDRVTTPFPPNRSFWTFEALLLDRPKRMEMQCVEALHILTAKPTAAEQEWLGTRIVWDFAEREDHTEITMTHIGLTPQLHCWDVCEDGWNFFFKNSLKAFLNGEMPSPHSG